MSRECVSFEKMGTEFSSLDEIPQEPEVHEDLPKK